VYSDPHIAAEKRACYEIVGCHKWWCCWGYCSSVMWCCCLGQGVPAYSFQTSGTTHTQQCHILADETSAAPLW